MPAFRDAHARRPSRRGRRDAGSAVACVSCVGNVRPRGQFSHVAVRDSRESLSERSRYVRRVVTDEDAMHNAVSGDDATATELRIEIERALALLEPDQREAFLLKHVEQLGYDEMAAVTGAGVSALKMRVKRACERLQELLGEVNDVTS